MVSNIIDRQFHHSNITLRKVIYFGIVSGIGAVIVSGGTYALTEWLGMWYILSTLVSGGVAFLLKFVITALWVFEK